MQNLVKLVHERAEAKEVELKVNMFMAGCCFEGFYRLAQKYRIWKTSFGLFTVYYQRISIPAAFRRFFFFGWLYCAYWDLVSLSLF